MAVSPRRLTPGENLPPNMRMLTYGELDQFIEKGLNTYEPSIHMAPLKYGLYVMGFTGSVCAFAITSRFQRLFKLRGAAGVMSSIAVVLPSALACITMNIDITRKLKRGEVECPVCVQTRSISFQTSFGAIYPTIAACLFCSAVAVPRALAPSLVFKDNLAAVVQFVRKRPTVYWASLLINCVVAGVWTYTAQEAAWKLHARLSGGPKGTEDTTASMKI